jgi:hypothetical protein
VVLLFMPRTVGELVLGRTFDAARMVAPIIAFEYAIGGWNFALGNFFCTFNRSADALKLRVSHILVVLVMALGGAVLFRTPAGVAAGIATATTLVTALWLLRRKPWATPASASRLERLQPVAPESSPPSAATTGGHPAPVGAIAAHDLLNGGMP